MNAKERVMLVLNQQKPDRMPCFGANSTVTYDQMEKVQATRINFIKKDKAWRFFNSRHFRQFRYLRHSFILLY